MSPTRRRSIPASSPWRRGRCGTVRDQVHGARCWGNGTTQPGTVDCGWAYNNGTWVMTTQSSDVSAFTEIYGPTATTGTWVYLAATYNGTTMRFCINGTE